MRYGQTQEPPIPVAQLFAPHATRPFPRGEELPHKGEDNAFRTTSEEKRAAERMNEDLYTTVRTQQSHGAEREGQRCCATFVSLLLHAGCRPGCSACFP